MLTQSDFLSYCRHLRDNQIACSMSDHCMMTLGVAFVVPDDEAYFVLEAEGSFWAIIGAFRVNTANEHIGFEVNQIHEFHHKLAAIACAMSIAINDSGATDCIHAHVREAAPYFTPY